MSYLLQLIIIVIALIARHRLEKKRKEKRKILVASSIAIDSRVKDQIGRPVSHVYRPRSRSAPLGKYNEQKNLSLSLSKFPRGINSCD